MATADEHLQRIRARKAASRTMAAVVSIVLAVALLMVGGVAGAVYLAKSIDKGPQLSFEDRAFRDAVLQDLPLRVAGGHFTDVEFDPVTIDKNNQKHITVRFRCAAGRLERYYTCHASSISISSSYRNLDEEQADR